MGTYLDIDDVVADHPQAKQQLNLLRAELENLKTSNAINLAFNGQLNDSLRSENERVRLVADYYCEALRTVLSMTHQPKVHSLVESVLIKGGAI